jgi:hypothetical protein
MIGWSEELDKYHRTYLFTVYGKRVFLRIHFLAQLAKGNVSFCHHLASVVC